MLPHAGTSDYQAAWIMDNEYADSEEEDDASNNQNNADGGSSGPSKASTSGKAGVGGGGSSSRKSSDGSSRMDGGEDDDIPDLELASDDGAGGNSHAHVSLHMYNRMVPSHYTCTQTLQMTTPYNP